MSDFIFVIVVLCVGFCLPILAGWLRWRNHVRFCYECRDKVLPVGSRSIVGNFSGLGDEPVWNGELPVEVNDYVRPRYVYENGVEKEEYDSSQGRVIGYRISPKLVIHSMVGGSKCWNMTDASFFKQHYLGHFLDRDEVLILRENWDIVSRMREAIGDTCLPYSWFWAYDGPYFRACHYRKDMWADPKECNVILKR